MDGYDRREVNVSNAILLTNIGALQEERLLIKIKVLNQRRRYSCEMRVRTGAGLIRRDTQ